MTFTDRMERLNKFIEAGYQEFNEDLYVKKMNVIDYEDHYVGMFATLEEMMSLRDEDVDNWIQFHDLELNFAMLDKQKELMRAEDKPNRKGVIK